MKSILSLLALVCASVCSAKEAPPPESSASGYARGLVDLPIVAEKAKTITLPVDPRAGKFIFHLKAGTNPAGASVVLKSKAGGPPTEFFLRARDLKLASGQVWKDAYLEGPRAGGRFFIRPNAFFYKEDRLKQLAATWERLPAASAHVTTIWLMRKDGVIQTWIDGRFVEERTIAGKITSCEVRLAAGAELHEIYFWPIENIAFSHTPLWLQRAGGTRVTTAQVSHGDNAPANTPDLAVAGLGRLVSPSDDLVSYTWRRGALDALPEVCIFSLPLKTCAYAQVLCAAEEDAAKVPAFTLRLTRYGTSRGEAMADTLVRIPPPGSPDTDACQRAGSVLLGPPGAQKSVPVWAIDVPLKTGLIPDLLTTDQKRGQNYTTHRYLDLEVMDPLAGVDENDAFPPTLGPTGRTYLPRGPQSSVHIFGITVMSREATLDVQANVPVNMFYASDAPQFTATARTSEPLNGLLELAWEFADVDGKIAATGRKPLTSSPDGHEHSGTIPVQVGNGWYATRFRVLVRDNEWIDRRGSFVMLPPDTRKAGFESPYGAWWFHWAHGGEPNIERVGPMLQRAGLRHTILPKTLPESLTAPYGVSAFNVGWFRPKDPKAPFAERLVEHEAYIREQLRLYPSLDKVLVWHESGAGGAPFPSEMWGETPAPVAETVEQNWQQRIEYVTALAKLVRAKFPQLKLQYGNDGSSLNLIAGLLRHKFPRELIDMFAVEDLGQTIIPEKAIPGGLQSAWYLRETARALGYGDVPITACHEWMGRRDMVLGLGGQAEWYVRDLLHARAYGFQTSGVGTVHDAGNGYYHTLWGDGGLCKRWPMMDPKPSYAAVATFTRVIDGTKFERALPTGTHTLYVVEFRRGDEWVYGVWVPRGRREAKVRFAGEADAVLTDLYGREREVRGNELDLTASTAAQYVVSRTRIASVAAGKASFPEDEPPRHPTVIDQLDTLAHWSIQPEKDKRLERVTGEFMPHRTQGQFELREVADPEQGKCLEIELKPVGEVWDVMHEYAVLKLANPVAAAGPFEHAGVWVKGNSGWGEVMWELENAKGEKWLSQGVYMDWPGNIAINFDGWNFLRLPLRPEPAWRSQVKITGLVVTMPRKTLYLTEMERVPELKVRLKGLSLF
jgi:hypothetical protein